MVFAIRHESAMDLHVFPIPCDLNYRPLMPFCPGAAQYWELLPFSRERVFVPGRQPLMSSAAHHPALCLLDIWLDLYLGLLGKEPSSLLLELKWSILCVSVLRVCVCVCECKHLSKCSWVGGRLVLYDCNWEWIYRSEWRDCGCVTPHTSPVDNSYQCSRVHVPKLCSQIPGFKTSLPTQLL